MRTEAQIAASRANGAKSRGPVTPEGKSVSSRNAVTHGILAKTVVLERESTARFLELMEEFVTEYHPRTATERALVEIMVVARWRQHRIWGLEKTSIDIESTRKEQHSGPEKSPVTYATLAFGALSDDSRSLDLMNRYDARYERQFHRAHRRFLDLVDRRTAQLPSEAREPEAPQPEVTAPEVVHPEPAPPENPPAAPEDTVTPNEPNTPRPVSGFGFPARQFASSPLKPVNPANPEQDPAPGTPGLPILPWKI